MQNSSFVLRSTKPIVVALFGASHLLSVGALFESHYHFQFSDPVLRPDRHYAYTVNVVVPSQALLLAGRAIPFRSVLSTEVSIDWHKLFKLIQQLQEELGGARGQLRTGWHLRDQASGRPARGRWKPHFQPLPRSRGPEVPAGAGALLRLCHSYDRL